MKVSNKDRAAKAARLARRLERANFSKVELAEWKTARARKRAQSDRRAAWRDGQGGDL